MDENGDINAAVAQTISDTAASKANVGDEGIDVNIPESNVVAGTVPGEFLNGGEIRTLDGDLAGDEFAADAINYQVLLGKIDGLLERLKLDA